MTLSVMNIQLSEMMKHYTINNEHVNSQMLKHYIVSYKYTILRDVETCHYQSCINNHQRC